MTETALYPIAEVQGLYRTISELRQQVAAADLYRADAMERTTQQDQTIDALKARIAELTATLTGIKDLSQTVARLVVDGLSEAEDPSRDYTGHINLMGALGDPDYMRGSMSCRHVDTRSTKPRSKKA